MRNRCTSRLWSVSADRTHVFSCSRDTDVNCDRLMGVKDVANL